MGAVQTEIVLSRFGRIRPFPGASATVRGMIRAGMPVVLASSADPDVVRRAIALLRLRGVLSGATTADDVGKTKPFGDVFALALSRHGRGRHRPVAIGDTPYDIAAAHQVGIPCIALRSGGFPAATLSRADAIFDGMEDLWIRGRDLFA